MISNRSVKKLQAIRVVYKVLFIAVVVVFFILGIIAATTQNADGPTIAGMVIGTILVSGILAVVGYIGLCFFDYFIYKRQENIDYMNARIEHLQEDINYKSARLEHLDKGKFKKEAK